MKAVEILEAWVKSIDPSVDDLDLARNRLEICRACDSFKEGFIKEVKICGECHCPVSYKDNPIGKVFTKVGGCPLKKW